MTALARPKETKNAIAITIITIGKITDTTIDRTIDSLLIIAIIICLKIRVDKTGNSHRGKNIPITITIAIIVLGERIIILLLIPKVRALPMHVPGDALEKTVNIPMKGKGELKVPMQHTTPPTKGIIIASKIAIEGIIPLTALAKSLYASNGRRMVPAPLVQTVNTDTRNRIIEHIMLYTIPLPLIEKILV